MFGAAVCFGNTAGPYGSGRLGVWVVKYMYL